METNKHALVLTGELAPGFDAERTWPEVAKQFRIDETRLRTDVLARVPMTIKESDDLADLEKRQAALTAMGALSEIHALTGGSYFALVDNVPRGPLPRSFIGQKIASGAWPAAIKVAAIGSSDWRAFGADAQMAIPQVPGVFAVDEADTVAANIAKIAGGIAGRLEQNRALPAGEAIHAGFWRRCAAYLIDNLILFVPSFILNVIPILGILLFIVGRWLYFALMESSASQATLGKRAMGLIVTDSYGRRIGFGQASGRYFAAAISYIILYVGYMLAGWTARKQALHDLMANTLVVFETVKPGQPLPEQRPAMPWYGWVANCLLLFVIPIGILAAIAIPAYQEYVTRAKISGALAESGLAKIDVAEAIAAGEACPSDVREGTGALVESITLDGAAPDCLVTLTFGTGPEVPAAIREQSVGWALSESGEWSCSSSIEPKYLPAECRY